MTRTEVIKGLECMAGGFVRCSECPYRDIDDTGRWPSCKREVAKDALALLKEEHRPLSLDDVLKVYHTLDSHVWPYNTPPYLWCEVKRKTFCRVTWREVMDIIDGIVTLRPFSIDNYGELWTLYMTRPDKEDTNREARMEEDHDKG